MNRFFKTYATCMALAMSFVFSLNSQAQTSVLATLFHEGEITSYYGVNALIEAYNQAVDGDVISLSSGQFNAVDVSKAITIRGAGINADADSHRLPTVLLGNFKILTQTAPGATFENIYHNGYIAYR